AEKNERYMQKLTRSRLSEILHSGVHFRDEIDQRIGDTLDFEIKRWSTGKQGNLRTLLSTLQY
ncbi:hypothetical protein ACJX0J_041638, partial [Zea mays]